MINNYIKEIQDENKTNRDFDLISKLENLLKSKLEDYYLDGYNKIKIKDYNENFYKLKCCLMESGITENEIKSKSETLVKIIQNYANIFGNYEKDQFYIDSRANSFLNGLKNKFIYAKDMTEKQYYQKIKQFINTYFVEL